MRSNHGVPTFYHLDIHRHHIWIASAVTPGAFAEVNYVLVAESEMVIGTKPNLHFHITPSFSL